MISNGKAPPVIDGSPWLDKALEGQPAEVKARVLEIALKFGVDVEDPFFLIFVALGQLQVLIETSPQDWQTLFTSFESELHQWTQTNLQTLDVLANKAETTETLARTSQELTSILTELVKVAHGLITHLQASNTKSNTWQPALTTLEQKLTVCLETVSQDLKHEHQTTRKGWKQAQHTQNRIWGVRKETIVLGLLFLSMAGNIALFLSQNQMLLRMDQRVEWILKKETRRECLTGIKSPESAECQGL